jgi:hypothetical protein
MRASGAPRTVGHGVGVQARLRCAASSEFERLFSTPSQTGVFIFHNSHVRFSLEIKFRAQNLQYED